MGFIFLLGLVELEIVYAELFLFLKGLNGRLGR